MWTRARSGRPRATASRGRRRAARSRFEARARFSTSKCSPRSTRPCACGIGRWLIVGRRAADSGDDLWLMPAAGGADARPYARASFNEVDAALSPTGRHMAYASDEAGQLDIYIDSFPTPGTRILVTTAGGREPRWRADGGELHFRRGSEIHAVALALVSGALEARATARLFDLGTDLRAYDASSDGSRFLVNVPATSAAPRPATLVVNWQPPGSGAEKNAVR
ncbi:MAG: hypothetical protein EXQ50_15310 [Acidobacteria bacterium]|nr:hypothetical protein [Acidobacteriota bacterium]